VRDEHERNFHMITTTNFKTTDAEMRALSDAELDAVVGGVISRNVLGDTTAPLPPGAHYGSTSGGTDQLGVDILAGSAGLAAGALFLAAIL
jgi:hypothetical protein